MEHEFKLNKKWAFDDHDLNLVMTMVKRRDGILVLNFLNTHIKMNTRAQNNFSIPVGVIVKYSKKSKRSIWRTIGHLVDEKILVKFDSGCYGWNLPGINTRWKSIHKKPEPKRTEQHKERPPKLVFNRQENLLEGFLN